MNFKEWLTLNEKAERTAAKVPLYPAMYLTKQYNAQYHTPYSGDYITWLDLELKKHTYDNYDKIWGKGQQSPYPPGASLIKVGPDDAPHHKQVRR
jgi:hypothetical protein